MSGSPKDRIVVTRVPSALARRVREIAEREDRTVAYVVRRAIEREVQREDVKIMPPLTTEFDAP